MERCAVIVGKLAPHVCGFERTWPCSTCRQPACAEHATDGVCDHCTEVRERVEGALTWEEMWSFDDNAHLMDRDVTLVSDLKAYDS